MSFYPDQSYQCPKCSATLSGPIELPVYCETCNTTYETWFDVIDPYNQWYESGLTGRRWWGDRTKGSHSE